MRWSARDLAAVGAIVGAGLVVWAVQPLPFGANRLLAWGYPASVVGFLVVIFLLNTGRTMRPHLLRRPGPVDWSRAGPAFRAAVARAQGEAIRLGHNYIGTEHLLLGLLADPTSPAGAVLAHSGLSLEASRQRIEEVIGRGDTPAEEPRGLTPRSKHAILLAFDRARPRGTTAIDDRLLLDGILAIDDGLGVWLVTEAGLSIKELRRATRARP